MSKLIFDFDDFHCTSPENCLKEIKELVSICPTIKILLFTSTRMKNIPIWSDGLWCTEVKSLIDSGNITLAVHGLMHTTLEFANITKQEALERLVTAENDFNRAGLPFSKIFKGPHWGINVETVEVLKSLGYNTIFDHWNTPKNVIEKIAEYGIQRIVYNIGFESELTKIEELININDGPWYLHGHTHNVCGNGIQESMAKIKSIVSKDSVEFISI